MNFAEAFPDLSAELQQLLARKGERVLADSVSTLQIADRCRCGDDFCASIYTKPKPAGRYGPTHKNIDLEPDKGMIILDVVDGRIHQIEILYRDEIRNRLHILLP